LSSTAFTQELIIMIDWSTTALIFPGQGSQQVGMGTDLLGSAAAAAVFAEADDTLKIPFTRLMIEGPAESLDDTMNTQPALYIAGIATLRAIESEFDSTAPLAAAGHSLGEFTALTAAGALSFTDGLKLVRERGRLMREAGEQSKGAMAALLGLDVADAQAVCQQATTETGHPVVVANDNCPGQVVISGNEQALDRALVLATEKGAKKAVKLAVSVAAHSPLMATSSDAFRQALAAITFKEPKYPVIGNVSAAPLRTTDEIRAELDAQLTSPVRWTESVKVLQALGATTFVELGSKDVLTGLLKRIDRSLTGIAVNTGDAVKALKA
jgi:[acyl-carrier-protein] S-malonyltransferase